MATETHTIDWELRLGFLIHDVSRLRRSAFDRCLKPLNVTRSQWWVLAYLSREDGMTQSQLAEELDLNGLWGFEHANTCSRPCVDAFGGGAHVLDLGTRKSIGWIGTHNWLAIALTGEDPDA